MKLSKDDVKIGTKAEKLWTDVLKEAQVLIEQSENNLVVQRAIMALAQTKIAQEKKKYK